MAYDTIATITVDGEQRRLSSDYNLVMAQGAYPSGNGEPAIGWDLSKASATAVDPATFTAFLAPYQNSPEWYTTFTGNYARKRITDFAFGSSSSWREHQLKAGDYWLQGSDLPANETIITTATFGKNRGLFVSFLNYNLGSDEYEVARFGWNSTATIAGGVGIKFFSSGRVEVYKTGNLVGTYQISGANTGSQTAQQWVSLLLIPGRHHELIVIPNRGKGFTHEFTDIATDASPTITPDSTKFWMSFPAAASGRSATVQICPITYATSGYICGQLSYFAVPPATADTAITAEKFVDLAYAGTTSTSVSMREATNVATAFAANGVKTTCYVRFDLTGDGNYTPFAYAAICGYTGVSDVTDDAESAELVNATTSRALFIGETADSDRLELYSIGISKLTSAGMEDPVGHGSRPIALDIGGQRLFDGVTLPPSIEGSTSEDTYEIAITAESRWKMLLDYQFREPYVFDGLDFVDALERLLYRGAFDTAEIDIEDPSLTLDSNARAASGEFALVAQPGDNAGQWIEKIFEIYAPNWFYGIVPNGTGTKFMAKSPTGLGTSVSVVLWPTVDEAVAQLVTEGLTTEEATKFAAHRVYQGFTEARLEPEANEIRVTGINPKTRQPIQAFKRDTASQDPATLPSARPANWLGFVRKYGYIEPKITSQTVLENCVELLYERLTPQRRLVSFQTSQLIRLSASGAFLWKPMRVTLKNIYAGVDATVRIGGLECEFPSELAWPQMSRPARYFGEIVSGSQPWRGSLRATNIEEAQMLHTERMRNRLPRPTSLIQAITSRGATVITAP